MRAQMALRYCNGSQGLRKPCSDGGEQLSKPGWENYAAVFDASTTPLHEAAKKTEAQHPEIEKRIAEIVEPEAQADLRFQAKLVYDRIIAACERNY